MMVGEAGPVTSLLISVAAQPGRFMPGRAAGRLPVIADAHEGM